MADRGGQALVHRTVLHVRADDRSQIWLRVGQVWIQVDIPETQVSELRMARRGAVPKSFAGIRMVCRGRQVSVEIVDAIRLGGNRQSGEGPRTVRAVIFFLRRTGIMEAEIGEVGRQVASCAVSGML